MNRRILSFTLASLLYFGFVQILLGQRAVELRPVVSGLQSPLLVTHAGDDSGRLFVVEQVGRIRIIRAGALVPQAFMDISSRVESGGEKGLLGLAFHPDFANNRRFFVNYTRRSSGQLQTVVAEYLASQGNADVADTTERILLQFDQPFENHNGGHLAFGPDGYLYVGTGDGGSGGDPQGNAQNLGSLLGKILRIDVEGSPYSIPRDNPVASGARPEIWAYGLRNPWRFSFDRLTGRLFAADVGQNRFEEVNVIQRGGNYGWNRMEAGDCYPAGTASCDRTGLILPIAQYGRDEGSSVTGGFVYRGNNQRSLFWGAYIFGDFGTGTIWYLVEEEPGRWARRELLRGAGNISSFGEDEAGELYVVNLGGSVSQIRFPSQLVLGHAADGPAEQGALRTSIVIVNEGESEVKAEIAFYGSEATALPVSFGGLGITPAQVLIPARSSRLFASSGTTSPGAGGWVEILSDGLLSANLLYGIYTPAGAAVAEAGVDVSALGRRFLTDVSRDSVVGLDVALALVNPSPDATAEVTISVKGRGGEDVGVRQLSLASRNQLPRFLGELVPLPDKFEGTVTVSSSVEIGLVLLRTQSGILLSSLPVAGR